MKVALYGRTFSGDSASSLKRLIEKIKFFDAELYLYKEFEGFLKKSGIQIPYQYQVFTDQSSLPKDTSFLFSFGGDGTFLQTVSIVGDSSIPVIGINAGRLGFLASISDDNLDDSIEALFNHKFAIEERTLIQIEIPGNKEIQSAFALNEISVHKKGMEMITIKVELDGEFLNSYWADGLIVSTPTGSTAYSLSVGGPIILPDSKSFILSPISPHTLTVRPLVIPDSKKIKLKVSSRSEKYLIAVDSTSVSASSGEELIVYKAGFTLKMARIEGSSFYNTLRNKLMWGLDKRN